ncbi:hypothetical protein FHS78_003291 [Parvibaculum indicum]|uniref:hypothetical protein n=1 Tax=Parvibaculum indicum TaxID=562969 RepID=UPI001420F621|nr:hypothetical protein [Parvibaculum indicum]NIJ42983.1 hypothetical protein [Parvibaculum indicum]
MPTPPPTYPADTPLSDLKTPELLLTTTLRLFAEAWRRPGEDCPDWRGGLLSAGLPVWGTSAFDGLINMVAAATRRPLDVRCPRSKVLSMDEGRLLQVVSLFQHGQPEPAKAALGAWLPPAAQRMAAVPAEAFARALKESGLVVPMRRDPVGRPAAYLIHANPGLQLVQ